MTRAYIRLDPGFDEHKEAYPDGPYAALVAVLCAAEAQPQRGRFRSLDYLTRLLGRRGRHVKYLVEHGDVTVQPDGRVYVDGWDEWQEGDWKVSERVGRIRNRVHVNGKRTFPLTGLVTPEVTVPVTASVTPDVTVPVTASVTPDVTASRQNVAERSKAVHSGGGRPLRRPDDDAVQRTGRGEGPESIAAILARSNAVGSPKR